MEIPVYTTDNYAHRFLRGQSIFPDDSRIFHRVGYQYDYLAGLTGVHPQGSALVFDAVFSSGLVGMLQIEAVAPGILRIRMGQPEAIFDEQSPMLLPLPPGRPAFEWSEDSTRYIFQSGGYRLIFHKTPFCLKVLSPQGETIFESETELLVSMLTAPPLGLRKKDDESCAFLSWRSRNEDRYYGLGEKFTRFEKTSSRATIWQEDTCGSNTSDMSYKAVPVLFSTAGWGLMLHSSFRSYWEIGSFSYATAGALVEDAKLDLFLFLAPTLKQLVQLYTGLTGRPARPPKWAFGIWMSRAPYRNRQELEEVADRLRAEQIPCDVFNIDPSWMKKMYYGEIGVEICNFEWDEVTWPEPRQLFASLAEKGFRACIWINPYFSEDSQAYEEAKEKGYLVKTMDGGISRLEFGLAAGMIDFTNPAAKAWWQEKLKLLLRQGAALFKVDFGDRIPEDALFFNGRTGKEMHNLYVHLYAQAVYEAVQEVKGVGLIWRRPGYIGSQRYPACWAGDTQVTWEGMKGALRGGLSAAFTGEAFWSHDIGGFVGAKPSPELYIRWAQFGMFTPLARFHGITPREPWHYGDEAVQVVRHYAQIRYSLVPYLLAAAGESVRTGLPILRPIVLEYQTEPGVDQIDDQYLLGNDLLVAPVFRAGAESRPVYFPPGIWRRLENPADGTLGPGYQRVEAPLTYIPVYVREGAVIPRYAQPLQHLQGPVPTEWTLDLYPGETQRILAIAEDGFQMEITYQFQGSQGSLKISPAPIKLMVRWVAFRLDRLRLADRSLQPQVRDGFTAVNLDLSQGVELNFGYTILT